MKKLTKNLQLFFGYSETSLLIWSTKTAVPFKQKIIFSNLWNFKKEVQIQ